jgi:predicted ABC-class ATPase
MPDRPQPIDCLFFFLKELEGQAFKEYQRLQGAVFCHDRYQLRFVHIQGSPGAFPASVCHLRLKIAGLELDSRSLVNGPRRLATADYLLRAFRDAVAVHARQNRGARGSGSFQPLSLPPQVLKRNAIKFDPTYVRIAFHVSLPGSTDNRILGHQAAVMFSREMAAIVAALKTAVARSAQLKEHCDVVEDMLDLQGRLDRYGLIAFVADGAILPRASGVSQAPLKEGAVPLRAPDPMAVEVEFPIAGRVRGLGIRSGVNVLIGAGFHGKSTLLDALAKGVYPHIPGDGRERVVTHPAAAFVCAENGRAISGLDISGFIDNLPGGMDATQFRTQNASGSTSEAAAIIEAVLAGAKLLLVDEDSSALNFLIKDHHMRSLITKDTITPLFDRVGELFQRFGVSSLIVVGGSSEYLGVAQHVIGMHNYLPVSMTDRVRRMKLPEPRTPASPLMLTDRRRVLTDNFDPAYRAQRLGKSIPVRIKPLRLKELVLEYGDTQLDLTRLVALVDPCQVLAVGYALLLARKMLKTRRRSPSELAVAVCKRIETKGLSILCGDASGADFLACPRRLELAGAINRIRNLKVELADLKK